MRIPAQPIRRTLLVCLAAATCGALTIASTAVRQSPLSLERVARKRYGAVAFDYLVLFNPDSGITAADRIAPRQGRELTNRWRPGLKENSW
jgi:hypothetical protein